MLIFSLAVASLGTVNAKVVPAPAAKGWLAVDNLTDQESEDPAPCALTCSPGDKTVTAVGAMIWGATELVVRTTLVTLKESKSSGPFAPLSAPENTAHSVLPSALIHLEGNCMPLPAPAVSLKPPQSL